MSSMTSLLIFSKILLIFVGLHTYACFKDHSEHTFKQNVDGNKTLTMEVTKRHRVAVVGAKYSYSI